MAFSWLGASLVRVGVVGAGALLGAGLDPGVDLCGDPGYTRARQADATGETAQRLPTEQGGVADDNPEVFQVSTRQQQRLRQNGIHGARPSFENGHKNVGSRSPVKGDENRLGRRLVFDGSRPSGTLE